MASDKLRDDMMEYIGIESASGGKKSSSPQDENGELLKQLDGSTNKCYPNQNGSHGSSNGNNSQKNEFQTSSEETIDEGSSSLKNGIDIPPKRSDLDAETLNQNGSCLPSKVNISNSDSRNGIHVSSIEHSSSKNGLGVHYGKEAEDGHVYPTMQEEKTSIPLPVSSTESCTSTKLKPNEGPQKDATEHKYQQNELKISLVDVVMEGTSSQVEDRSSNESASSVGIPLLATDDEPGKRFAKQAFMHLNSGELQLKIQEIDKLVCQLSAFKPPTFSESDEMKPAGPEFDSEGKSKPEHSFPKRKSKQSEFEDPEELQLISKKAKMNTLEEQNNNESRSDLSEQFRFAYKEAIDEVLQGTRNKTFNFAENDNEYLKEKLRFEKELDAIADRVLRAMSLDEDFTRKELDENTLRLADDYTDENAVSRGIQTEREAWKLSRDWYDFSNSSYPRVRIASKANQALRDGVLACTRRPSDHVAESTTFNGTSFCRKVFELLKSLVLLGLLIPFLFLTCVLAKMCSLCLPSEVFIKNPKNSGNSREVKKRPTEK